jgi:hypothetical protein
MSTEDPSSRSLVDQEPDLLVHIPEADEGPEAPPIVIEDRPKPWYRRREALWVVLGALVVLVAVLYLIQPQTSAVTAVPEGGNGGTGTVEPLAPPWTAIAIPVPESMRTLTVNVDDSIDVLQVAALGPGAAQSYDGNVTTADGPTVQQIFSDQAFSIASPTGATVVAFLPYQAGVAPIVGQEVTFIGTLMPVPADFGTMAGTEAASIAALTGVYVLVTPETLSIVTPVPETT